MDYTDNLGYCQDATHHYYSSAKEAFNALNSHQRSLFTTHAAYSLEWNRLSTWASINGDSLSKDNLLSQSFRISHINTNDNSLLIAVIALSIFGLTTAVYVWVINKRKRLKINH